MRYKQIPSKLFIENRKRFAKAIPAAAKHAAKRGGTSANGRQAAITRHAVQGPASATGALATANIPIATGAIHSKVFPILGPKTMAPASAAQPPMECTTVDPAKSIKPKFSSHPPPFNKDPHAQEPKTG